MTTEEQIKRAIEIIKPSADEEIASLKEIPANESAELNLAAARAAEMIADMASTILVLRGIKSTTLKRMQLSYEIGKMALRTMQVSYELEKEDLNNLEIIHQAIKRIKEMG